MTSFRGQFESDLPLESAVDACASAIRGLSWELEKKTLDRIVCYPTAQFPIFPPTVEVILHREDDSTVIEIVGVDHADNPLDGDTLLAELERVRDAIKRSMAEGGESSGNLQPELERSGLPVAGDRELPSGSTQLATQRRALAARVRENGGALVMPVSELLEQFAIAELNARAVDTTEAFLLTAGLQTTPPLGETGVDDSVTLSVSGMETKSPASNGDDVVPAGWYPDQSNPLSLQWWDGERWTGRRQSVDLKGERPAESSEQQKDASVATSRLAIASLASAVVWLLGIGSMLAILLGGMALKEIEGSDGRRRGRDLAMAGILLGAIGACVTIGVAIATLAP